MASITKRESGYYQVRIRRRGYAPISRGFTRRADAEAWARKTESELERGVWRDSTPLETTTLKDLITTYRERELPKKRGVWFAPALRSLDDHLGRYPLGALTSRVIADYRDVQVKRHGRASSVRLELTVLSSMLDLAAREWGIPLPSNPCKMVTRPPAARARTRRVEAGELGHLVAVSDDRLMYLACLAIESAARLGELLALRWQDVTDTTMTLHGIGQRGLKNGDASRTVPLSATASAALADLKAMQAQERIVKLADRQLVFGRYWSSTRASTAWIRMVKRAGVDDLHFHDLRHEAASRLFELGVFDTMEVASITGHKTLQMLKRYTHLRADRLADKLRAATSYQRQVA